MVNMSPIEARINSLLRNACGSGSLILTREDDDLVARVLTNPKLLFIKELSLNRNSLIANGVDALASSTYTQNLQQLSVVENEIGDEGVKALASSPYLKKLKRLELIDCHLGNESLTALANSRYLQLEKIVLLKNKIGDEGVRNFVESPNARSVTYFDLRSTAMTDIGALAISNSQQMQNVKELLLGDNNIGDVGAAVLAQSPNLKSLEVLNLALNPIGDDGFFALSNTTLPKAQIFISGNFNKPTPQHIHVFGALALFNITSIRRLSIHA